MADSPTDPQENPTNTDHLPGAGEVGNGPISYRHDPVTADTDDDTVSDDAE